MSEPQRNWVVVTLGGDSGCGVSRCPVGADGPFTHEDAREHLRRLPDRLHPHVVVLTPTPAKPMGWGDLAGVERVIRAGFAPRSTDDFNISVGPGPSVDTLEVLAEQAAVTDVLHALTVAGYPARSTPVDQVRREQAKAMDPTSLAAADGILSIIVSRPVER